MNWVLTLSEELYEMPNDQIRSQVAVIAGITRLSDMRTAQQRTVSELFVILFVNLIFVLTFFHNKSKHA